MCVCMKERDTVCVCVRERYSVCEREIYSVYVCVKGRERKFEKQRRDR